jgi:hypothetical protein
MPLNDVNDILRPEQPAEITDISDQTINDIEGCRTWVSDKTIVKIARNTPCPCRCNTLPVSSIIIEDIRE